MQIENTRQLHLLVGKGAFNALDTVNYHMLKKKYPGEHIALVREEDMKLAQASDLFSEVHGIDFSYLQRCSFSPLLGDELAFSQFYDTLSGLTSQKWTRIFNTKGTAADTALSELFASQFVLGTCAKNNEKRCQEPPLKLLRQLDSWRMNHPVLQKLLVTKAYGQLDWTKTEVSIQKILDVKNAKQANQLKNIVVGVNFSEAQDEAEKLALLQHLFTVVDLEQEDSVMSFFVDMVITTRNQKPNTLWSFNVPMDNVDPDHLSEILGTFIPRNLTKWASMAFLFDYLGNARAALASEKIMARYDREALQQFLMNEVMTLKNFAKILLDGLRKQGSDMQGPLENYWATNAGTISFTSAIELSLHPSIVPLLRNDQDVLAIKKRMRTLNQFYERIHKATALEMPKTDLGLTL